METISVQTRWPRPDLLKARADTADEPFPILRLRLAWIAVAFLGVTLRAWNIGAVFESSDQAAMAHMVRHGFGIEWIFAHNYGPVLPAVQKAFATVLMVLRLPLNEASARWPVMLISCGQVLMTYSLLRRLRRPPTEALAGMLVCALLPGLVTDARYSWGSHTLWLFFGTVALWATLAYVDDRRWWQLLAAVAALMLHCLSGLYAFALPVTLLGAWWLAYARSKVARSLQHESKSGTGRPVPFTSVVWPFLLGYVIPCLGALSVIVLSFVWTDKGQIGYLLGKRDIETFGLHIEQIGRLGPMWISQLGLVFGLIAAFGLLAGSVAYFRLRPYGLLALWAWNALLPVLLLTDWSRTGYPAYYLLEAMYPAALLGAVWLVGVFRIWPGARPILALAGVFALAQLAAAGVDICTPGTKLRSMTGIHTGWGNVRPDTGIKAAGWYVRRYVPIEAVVMSLHTNDGMEVNISEYYCGRRIIAHYDILPSMVAPLLEEMKGHFDVVIVDAEHEPLAAEIPGFVRVCRLFDQDRPVRMIYAHKDLSLPRVCTEIARINPVYDYLYTPRRIPLALPAAPTFLDKLARYQTAIKQLQATRFAAQRP